jgi:hypothetical protein
MIQNDELLAVMEKLEAIEDEQLAVKLLKEFNDKSKALGVLITNRDESLPHLEWKKMCDQAKKELDDFIEELDKL